MGTQLYRSRSDRMMGGVCGGLGSYLRIDSNLIRLFFVLLALAGNGIGLLVYLLLWIFLPEEGREPATSGFGQDAQSSGRDFSQRAHEMGEEIRQAAARPNPQAGMIIGGALVILGVIYLLQNLNFAWLSWLDFDILWPLLLVVIGIMIILRRFRGGEHE